MTANLAAVAMGVMSPATGARLGGNKRCCRFRLQHACANSPGAKRSHTRRLVREMLRPMLKVWLDDNLPSLVERLVRAEIERVSRGRG